MTASSRCKSCSYCFPSDALDHGYCPDCAYWCDGNVIEEKAREIAQGVTWETSAEHDALQGALPLDGTASQEALPM